MGRTRSVQPKTVSSHQPVTTMAPSSQQQDGGGLRHRRGRNGGGGGGHRREEGPQSSSATSTSTIPSSSAAQQPVVTDGEEGMEKDQHDDDDDDDHSSSKHTELPETTTRRSNRAIAATGTVGGLPVSALSRQFLSSSLVPSSSIAGKGGKPDPDDDASESSAVMARMEPLTERNRWLRLDVMPFAVLYALLLALDYYYYHHYNSTRLDIFDQANTATTTTTTAPRSSYGSLGITVAWSATLFLHLAVVLVAQWDPVIRARVGYFRCTTADDETTKGGSVAEGTSAAASRSSGVVRRCMTHVLVQADDRIGIVPVIRQKSTVLGGKASSIDVEEEEEVNAVVTCEFHHRVYRWSAVEPDDDVALWMSPPPSPGSSRATTGIPVFRPLFYPIHLTGDFYMRHWRGHSLASATAARILYGPNPTLLHLPSFGQLLGEQVLAPLFLFQLFCVLLWSLDEFFWYAIYTLLALLVFESSVAYHRLHSLQRLHNAGHHGLDRVWVWRRGGGLLHQQGRCASTDDIDDSDAVWMVVNTRELVPGDVMALPAGVTVPADSVILHGTAVCDEALLTGESVPQLKRALDLGTAVKLDLQDSDHKESVLFGGTGVLAATSRDDGDGGVGAAPSATSSGAPLQRRTAPPNGGVVAVVLRTGFETTQGSLLRTLASAPSSAKEGVNNRDTFVFIALLVVCAIVAAGYVLHHGWTDERRNRFRLVLHVVIIVTSVVPPELPMELSLAVTNAVADLMKRAKVYCTEHYRIPLAGEVNVCCFDKTGTLTSDEMRLKGVCLVKSPPDESENGEDEVLVMPDEEELPWPTLRIMAGCHSLAFAGVMRQGRRVPTIVGDPLEVTVLKHTGFDLVGNDRVVSRDSSVGKPLTILHRFAFSSKLKRMTTLVAEESNKNLLALCKGAPETIKELASAGIPHNFDDITFYHMSRGRRVLAMAYRELGTVKQYAKLKDGGRDAIECNLTFAGFLILDCPLKPDTKSVISELRKSRHMVVMITGDALLTAAEVARQVGIIRKGTEKQKVYRIQSKKDASSSKSVDVWSNFECVSMFAPVSDVDSIPLSESNLGRLRTMESAGEASFCMTGETLTSIAMEAMQEYSGRQHRNASALDEKHLLLHPASQSRLAAIVPLISVFARHTPHQKEAVVAAFNRGGYKTCMCGDGTNDVGALRRASVGISIISAPDVESKQRTATENLKRLKPTSKAKKKTADKGRRSRTLDELQRELREAQEQIDHVELGDASVAAPFTSRQVSIKCCKDVIQQGRCTLVSMVSIYKILGVNCLVNAMVLSKLFLHGAKQGDRQLVILGIAVAALFYFVTRAEPLPTLSPIRPPSSILCLEALLSIAGQFVVHCSAILAATDVALAFVDSYDPSLIPDGPFNANVLNTCTFLLMCLATINTFAVNYRGSPFMADLSGNKLLYRTLQACYITLGACALEVFPPLNDLLQLTALPTGNLSRNELTPFSHHVLIDVVESVGFPAFLCGLMVADTVAVVALNRWIIRRFEVTVS